MKGLGWKPDVEKYRTDVNLRPEPPPPPPKPEGLSPDLVYKESRPTKGDWTNSKNIALMKKHILVDRLSAREIASKLGITFAMVHNTAHKLGVKFPKEPRTKPKRELTLEETELFVGLYALKVGLDECGKIMGIASSTLWNRLQENPELRKRVTKRRKQLIKEVMKCMMN